MHLQYLPPKSFLLANMGCWEETQWRRITLDIIHRWENERGSRIASHTRHRRKWTRILAERQAAKCSQAAEWCQESDGDWEVLTSDDDEEDTTAGAPAVAGHGRSAEGQAGSSAASRERPAVARRAGEAARASARQVAPRLADSRRLDAVTNSSPEPRGEMARRFRDAVQLRRAAGRAKTTRPLSHRSEAAAGS